MNANIIREALIIVILGLGLLLATSSMAGKGANQYAYPFKDSYCFDWEDFTICYSNRGVVLEVNTPSGNTSFLGTGFSSYTQTDKYSGELVYQDTLKYLTDGLTMDAVLKVLSQSFTSSLTVGGGTCVTTYQFQFVNNEIRVDRNTDCR